MSADVTRARIELREVRDDLDKLTTLATQIAIAARDGSSVDHQTAVELVASVAIARDTLQTVEECLAGGAEGEVAS